MATAFARFAPRLQEAIVARLGWSSLRPVQEMAGSAIMDGKNVVVLAPTAGGKTEASVFPMLSDLVERPVEGVGLVYVAPIKALLNNQEERLGVYTEMVGLRRFVWHGDVSSGDKREFEREPAELLMTTPESLEVMLLSPKVPVVALFRHLRGIIIDEIHAFAGVDRGAHLMSVLERIARICGTDIQRVGLSATVGNPDEIRGWIQGSSRRDSVVIDPPRAPTQRDLRVLHYDSVGHLAQDAAKRAESRKSLFFCQSRALTESVAERMRGTGTDVYVHHSSVSLEERQDAEKRFHHGTNACIVCTSTLELGIDVGDLDAVFQANAPSTVSSFLQRMGRTGRREGQVPNTTFLCEEGDAVLQSAAIVELARERWVESVARNRRCWPVLVHQVLAMTLQFGAISAERIWEQLCVVPDFSEIGREEFDAVVEHMVEAAFLFEAGGLLSMGDKAERVYGRRNFMEMYAVFSSPVLYRVRAQSGRELGSLEQDFVDRLVENMSSFLLAGRAWTVERVSHKDRVVLVSEAPRGRKPSWGGFLPQLLSFELCQKMRHILISGEAYPYLDDAAARVLGQRREDMAELLGRHVAIQVEGQSALWWTYAGGRINYTVKYGLELISDWKVVADNLHLRVEGDGVSDEILRDQIRTIAAPEFWFEGKTRRKILHKLPEYRLSKFQRALPDHHAVETVGAYLLDFDGTAKWLASLDLG